MNYKFIFIFVHSGTILPTTNTAANASAPPPPYYSYAPPAMSGAGTSGSQQPTGSSYNFSYAAGTPPVGSSEYTYNAAVQDGRDSCYNMVYFPPNPTTGFNGHFLPLVNVQSNAGTWSTWKNTSICIKKYITFVLVRWFIRFGRTRSFSHLCVIFDPDPLFSEFEKIVEPSNHVHEPAISKFGKIHFDEEFLKTMNRYLQCMRIQTNIKQWKDKNYIASDTLDNT